MIAIAVVVDSPAQLDGLKAIADFIERDLAVRGVVVRALRDVDVWKWTVRRHDPLPTYRRRTGKGRMADPVTVTAWLRRQRFTLASDGRYPTG